MPAKLERLGGKTNPIGIAPGWCQKLTVPDAL